MAGFDEPLSDKQLTEGAEAYRLAVAARLLKCFEDSVGRAARTTEELTAWVEEHDDLVPRDTDGTVVPLYEGGGA